MVLVALGFMVGIALTVLALAVAPPAPPAAANTATPAPDALEVIAVDAAQPTRIVFAAPPPLATRTLTDADLEVAVDGQPRQESLQRLSANDIEIAVVVDTTLDTDDLRTLQGAMVELALELPQGATMTIVDAQGSAAQPAAVPGPAISAIRSLRPTTPGDLDAAVARATTALDQSQRARTALLVVGRDLADRLSPVDDRPIQSMSYLISIGDGDPAALLGQRAAGTAVAVDAVGGVLGATDDVWAQLRSAYLVEIPMPDTSASTVTLAVSTPEVSTPATTVALDPEALRPTLVDPADGAPDTAGDQQADSDTSATGSDAAQPAEPQVPGSGRPDVWVPWLLFGGIALAVLVPVAWLLARRRGRAPSSAAQRRRGGPRNARTPTTFAAESSPLAIGTSEAHDADPSDDHSPWLATPPPDLPPERTTAPQASTAVVPEQPLSPIEPPRRRATARPQRHQRPIAKLAPQTREALARAHLGLRQLALASRETTAMVPDDMFRLSEARASAAIDGYDRPLRVVLLDMLDDHPDETAVVVARAAEALETGWQHTARRSSAPPAVVEINAVLHGETDSSDRRSGRPTVPVRALNPLVEIGLEHMVLVAESDTHAGLVARAVTAVDIMRAARLARPVLTMSPHLLESVERYHAACAADPADAAERDDWLQLLCEAIAQRSYASVEQLHRLRRVRGRYRDAAPSLPAARLIDVLLARPVLDLRLIAARLSLSIDEAHTTAVAAHDVGWLTPHPEDPDAWMAAEVLDIFASTASDKRQPV